MARLKKYDQSLDKEGTPMITMAGEVYAWERDAGSQVEVEGA